MEGKDSGLKIEDDLRFELLTEKEVEMENSTYCLGRALSLEPDQEEDILVPLEGEWREDTVVSRHPDFDEPNIKVVGEVADGGDHMYVSFKNLSDHPVTIKENTTVVQLHPRSQGDCLPSLLHNHEDGNMMMRIRSCQVNQVRGGFQLGNREVDIAGICMTDVYLSNISTLLFSSIGQL